jgi:hypothetical protein
VLTVIWRANICPILILSIGRERQLNSA